jgi:pseudouridine synthase
MAEAGIGSRRACEALIDEGRVTVNGEIVRRLPVLVTPGVDRITVDNEPLERYMPRPVRQAFGRTGDASRRPRVYVMLYKPRGTLTTMNDPDQRRTVADLVRHPSGIRLYPVGRLDYDTLGLLLLTNDGELANRLTHPRYEIHKTYRAIVKGALGEAQIERLRAGTYLADRKAGRTAGASRTRGVDLTIVRTESQRTILDITLKEGRNRQVRRILADAGCPVRKLVRIAMGPLMLKGLKAGQWRDLTPSEVAELHRAATGAGPKEPPVRALVTSHAMKTGVRREGGSGRPTGPPRPAPTPPDSPARRPNRTPPARGGAVQPKKGQAPAPPAPPARRARFPLAEPPPRLRT